MWMVVWMAGLQCHSLGGLPLRGQRVRCRKRGWNGGSEVEENVLGVGAEARQQAPEDRDGLVE